MSQRIPRRSFLALLGAVSLPSALARATPREQRARVALGVAVGGESASPFARALDAALHEELARNPAIELVEPTRAVFLLNASVREDAAQALGGQGCVVSVLVEERRSRRLRAILEGSARAPSLAERVEADALVRVAVRSALRSLGRALG